MLNDCVIIPPCSEAARNDKYPEVLNEEIKIWIENYIAYIKA